LRLERCRNLPGAGLSRLSDHRLRQLGSQFSYSLSALEVRRMAFILTFLGKGGVGRTTIAIAAAKKFARQGKRVLLIGSEPAPALSSLGVMPGADPQAMEPNLSGVQLQISGLLERAWEDLKQREREYLRTPILKEVYGQELGVLPGLDSALTFHALRQYDDSGQYDVIVYDGSGDQTLLRMLGMPDILSWYFRRFRQVFNNSDLGRIVTPLLQPIAGAVLNISWTDDIFNQPMTQEASNLLDQGKQAIADPQRMAAYLVTTPEDGAIATAKYLWGAAQQVGLTVGGVLLNRAEAGTEEIIAFAPLPLTPVPIQRVNDWQPLIDALPEFDAARQAPPAIAINIPDRKVSLFLPGFDRTQVKLTQSGPEITIEAGDQRRNIFLPAELRGQPVKTARFQDGFLIISF